MEMVSFLLVVWCILCVRLCFVVNRTVSRRHSGTTVAYSSMKNENAAEDDDMPVEANLDEQFEISVRKDLA